MAAFMPMWRPLDAAHSVRLLSERPRGGRVVALCVAPGLAGRPEGARLAVGLARRWTEGGLSVVLADGDLARPILHLSVGLTNGKGLADLLLVGDPWRPMATPTAVPGLRVITAGGSAAPTGAEAARDRLAELCLDVLSEGGTLALYVPLGTMLAEWALEVCTDIMVLAVEGEDVSGLFAEDEDRIRAQVGPPLPQHQRALEPAMPPRPLEAEPRPLEPEAVAPPEGEPPEPEPPPRPAPPRMDERWAEAASSRIEVRWAEAAAELRSHRKGPPPPPATPGPAPQGELELPPAPRPAEPARRAPQVAPPPAPVEAAPAAARVAPAPTRPGPTVVPAAELGRLGDDDDLETPPIGLAEWHRFGEHGSAAGRSARVRTLLLRGAVVAGGVAALGGVAWIWSSMRDLPPYEARTTALPRASIPPEGPAGPPGDSADAAVGAAVGDSAVAGDPVPGSDTASSRDTASGPAAPGPASAGPAPAGALARPGVPETRAPQQRYSWSMAALGTMEAARGLVERLRRRAPGEAFMISPIVADGRTLYRVLAGLAVDRDELARIRAPLGQATGQPPEGWLARETPLAFALQDFDEAAAAAARVAELARAGVPAYVLVVERDDASRVHRVYAGAYLDEAEAAPMRGLLEGAGIRAAALAPRKGRAGG